MKLLIALLVILHLSSFPIQAEGQGMRPWRKEGRCLRASELNLTSEQIKGLQHLQQSYLQETQTLRAQLIAKRIELRELLTNSSSRMEIIRMKYMELAEAQIRMEEKTIDYLIKIRHLLTPEQLLLWCPEEEFPMPHKTMPGHRPFKPMPPMKIPPPEE